MVTHRDDIKNVLYTSLQNSTQFKISLIFYILYYILKRFFISLHPQCFSFEEKCDETISFCQSKRG